MPTPPAPPRPPRRTRKTTDKDTPQESGTPVTPDTPPRRESPGGGAKGAGAGARPRATKLQSSLEELFAAPAMAYALAGDPWASSFVAERAPVMAKAWADLATESPAVRRILERLTTGSAWGGVFVATGGTVLPLLAHHELLPPPVAGVFNVPTRGEDGERRGPIVPPPPAPDAGDTGDYSPPVGNGPPGVVTVQGTTASHNGARGHH